MRDTRVVGRTLFIVSEDVSAGSYGIWYGGYYGGGASGVLACPGVSYGGSSNGR